MANKKAFVYTEVQISVPFDQVSWRELNPVIKAQPGFLKKTWLSGVGNNSVGGFYEFDSIENARKFAHDYFPEEAKKIGAPFTLRIFDGEVVEEASVQVGSPYYFQPAPDLVESGLTDAESSSSPRRLGRQSILGLAVGLLVGLSSLVSGIAHADQPLETRQLLSQTFQARTVNKIDIGDFHFTPGQPAPIHTHDAPVFGYVSKGTIYYQVEGQQPQLLRTGDAFYEPVGPRILHFDNASKTEEAIFTDLNLQREGEPFIVFPTPPTAKIDRRAFPTPVLDGASISAVRVAEQTLQPSAAYDQTAEEATVFYVAEGDVSLQLQNQLPVVYHTGETFFEPKDGGVAKLVNVSSAKAAKLIAFHLIAPR